MLGTWPAFAQQSGRGTIRMEPSGDVTGKTDQKSIGDAIASLEAGGGGVLTLGIGDFYLRSRLRIRNRVTLCGTNGRPTQINPGSEFSDECMFEFWNEALDPNTGKLESISQFSCRLQELAIRGTVPEPVARALRSDLEADAATARIAAINSGITRVVWGRSWNEQCGLRNVLICEYLRHAVLFTDAYGGTATFELRECEFQASNAASTTHAGVSLSTNGRVGFTNAMLHHVTVTGPQLHEGYRAIEARNGINLIGTGLHVENCEHGIWMAGRSNLTLTGYTGSPSGVANLITCDEDFGGKVFGAGVLKAGATGMVLRDLKRKRNIAEERNPLVYP